MFLSRFRVVNLLIAIAAAVLAAPAAPAQSDQVISLTVDATQSPRKLLHAHLSVPVSPSGFPVRMAPTAPSRI